MIKKRFILILCVTVSISCAYLMYIAWSLPPTTNVPISIPSEIILPVSLLIPHIHVETPIEPVGITSAGAMDVPKNIENVAWFAYGPVPGTKGSAVIAGHYGWKDEKASAFDDLHLLVVGDTIHVVDMSGATTTFAVREIKLYPFDADTAELFISTDGKSHLNLITCNGVWNTKLKTYSQRLVVFTDKVE